MATRAYRAAVIGLTGIGMSPAAALVDPVFGPRMPHSHVAAYAASPRCSVVAVCDLVPALLERFRETWGGALPQARTYTDYREMLANENVDLLSVATSDHLHAQMVVDGVEAGVKGVFCEKPIATTVADADRMIAACEARGVPLLIDHTTRWLPQYAQARGLIRSGAIGQIRRVMVTGVGPRAMLFRNTTHVADMLCYLVESDPAWLTAQLDDGYEDYPPRYAGDGGKDPATDPGCSAYVHFRNGVRAFVNCSQMPMTYREWDVIGDTGRIRLGPLAGEMWQQLEAGRIVKTPLSAPNASRADMLAAVEELVDLVERGGSGSSSGQDGRRTLSILLGILQSNAAGGARVTFPIQDR
jgi:predicted dehydrogenase